MKTHIIAINILYFLIYYIFLNIIYLKKKLVDFFNLTGFKLKALHSFIHSSKSRQYHKVILHTLSFHSSLHYTLSYI